MVPPLMIQTLVENGIKHGIAHLPEGGTLVIEAKLDPHFLIITITNSGQYDSNKISETGFGIENTQERLRLLFAGKASFEIKNKNKTEVICVLKLPKILTYMKVKTIVVDDERLGRKELLSLIEQHSNLEVIADYGNLKRQDSELKSYSQTCCFRHTNAW